uniref:Uncharacterized protein n=1 Tax=Eptatretus burgeri TaxID=7764 RepID=A0A8C4R351_EPTBU
MHGVVSSQPVTFLPPPAPASSTRLLLPPAAILGLAVLAYVICLGLVFALRNCLLVHNSSVVPWLPPGCDCTCAWQPPQCDACNCICFEIRLR